MNLIFWRNVFCVAVIVTFVLDIFFGNGIESWFDWFIGAGFGFSICTLMTNFDGRSRR